jgi:hypothetical protein
MDIELRAMEGTSVRHFLFISANLTISIHQSSNRPQSPEGAPSDPNLRGVRLLELYKDTRSLIHLEEATQSFGSALVMNSIDNRDCSNSLSNLASAVLTRSEQLGAIEDLHEGIELHRNALALHPVGHPDRSRSLSNLSDALPLGLNN